ncbi:5698_t:CDS:2, partial [Gigaspora margarita]
MLKFNPAEYKNESLINNHDEDQFKEEIIYLSPTIKTKLDSKSDQFNSISKRIINGILNNSKYKQTYDKKTYTLFYCRSNNDYLFQNFDIYKIIERVDLHSIHHYYQILPTPNKNHISLYYGDYSFSEIEILYSELRTMIKYSTLNADQKTEFVSETINDVDSSFSFLNTLESIKAPNKSTIDKNEVDPDDNRILKIQQGIGIVKEKLKEYNDFNLIFNKICNEVADLEAKLSVQLWGSTVCEVKQVTYSRENKVKPPGWLPKKTNDPYSKKYNFGLFLIERIMINEEDKYLTKIINELNYFEEISKNKQSKSIFLKKTVIRGDILAFQTNIELESFLFKNDYCPLYRRQSKYYRNIDNLEVVGRCGSKTLETKKLTL